MDHVALDAVLDWLDVGALLVAGGVCRAWRGRALRREAWAARRFPPGRGSATDVRLAWSESRNALRRWRRGTWSEQRMALPSFCHHMEADGDWLAWAAPPPPRMDPEDRNVHSGTKDDTIQLYDASTRRRAELRRRQTGRCLVSVAPHQRRGLVAALSEGTRGKYACEVWDGRAEGHGAHAAYDGTLETSLHHQRLFWHGDSLLMCENGLQETATVERLVVRDDGGGLCLADRRAYRIRRAACGNPMFAASHDELYLVTGWHVRTLDLRRPDHEPAESHHPHPDPHYIDDALVVGDGRHVATTESPMGGRLVLHDVRAAGTPAAEMHEPTTRHKRPLCGTSGGTLLVWSERACTAHSTQASIAYECTACCYVLQEWDPRDGAVRDLVVVRRKSCHVWARCADERRIALRTWYMFPDELRLLDATVRTPLPEPCDDDRRDDDDAAASDGDTARVGRRVRTLVIDSGRP